MADTMGPAVEDLRDHVAARLAACGAPACLVSLQPGNTVAWDMCCECGGDGEGQMWVRVISAVAKPASTQVNDVTHLQVRVAVGVVRCMHGVDSDGNPPTAAEMDGDTLRMTRDADRMMDAIRSWAGTPFVVRKFLQVEQGVSLGPQGYCGGWEWTLSFPLQLCPGC